MKTMVSLAWRWSECAPTRTRQLAAFGRRPATTTAEATGATTAAIRLRASAGLTKPNLPKSGTFCS